MGRKIVPLTRDNVEDLPSPCRTCTLWELASKASGPATKGEWVSSVLLDWGSCGRVLYVDDDVAGFATYAPSQYVEGAHSFVGTSVSPDAVLLMTARILPAYLGGGLGRLLIQSVVKDLMGRRRVRGIEAFGDAQGHENSCVVPAAFLTAVGFKTIQAHPRYPRLRLDLHGVLTWRDDVELAVERWLGAIRPSALRPGSRQPEPGAGPVGAAPRHQPRNSDSWLSNDALG
ncbi:MAG: GNAT family N-acetyltransferase [Nocardioidaceae bacterium]